MPTVHDDFSNTLNKINANLAANIIKSVARGGGSDTSLVDFTQVSRPNEFTGSSNAGITDALVASGGPFGLTIGYVSGSVMMPADEIRKLTELTVANANIANQDGLNTKNSQREQDITPSGLIRTIHGTFVNATGAVVVTPGFVLAASGLDENGIAGRLRAQDYNYRVGLTNVDKSLPIRTI
jgi:hypothetical protein